MDAKNSLADDLAAYDIAVLDVTRALSASGEAKTAYQRAVAALQTAERARDEIRARILAHGSSVSAKPAVASQNGNGAAVSIGGNGFAPARRRPIDDGKEEDDDLDNASGEDEPSPHEDPPDEEPVRRSHHAPRARATAPPVPRALRMPPPNEREAKSMGVWSATAALDLWNVLSDAWKPRFHRLMVGSVPVVELFDSGTKAGPQFAGLVNMSRAATKIMSAPLVSEDGIARLSDGLANAFREAGIRPPERKSR